MIDRKGGFIHTQRIEHVSLPVNLSEPTIYRERRQRALNAWFRIISKGRVVIKKVLSVVAMGFFTLGIAAVTSPAEPGPGDPACAEASACW
ncbi:hypothetical protein GCM10029976_053760 [Kribbella albertanoniae]